MADMLIELPIRPSLTRLERDELVLLARSIVRRWPGDERRGFHVSDKRIVDALKEHGIASHFIRGDGGPGWWFIQATDVLLSLCDRHT